MQKNDLSVKEAIISTTKELLIKKGNITIKDIAEAAYVNVAAINYHFGSKDNLIQIVTQRVVKDLRTKIVEQINAIDQSNYDFEEIIKLAIVDKQPYSWRAAWLLWSCMDKNDQRIHKYIKK